MSSKINLQTCEYARKSSIFQDNQLILDQFYIKSTDVMTPTSVRIEVDQANSDDSFDTSEDVDSDGYLTISLDSSELQYMFSIYGDLEVGDDVVLVCNRNGSSYTAVDALEY